MRKQRTREHIIADLSVNYVERFFLKAGHTAQRTLFDYGYDLFVQTFTEEGELEPDFFLVQLKATENPRQVRNGAAFALTVERRDLEAWQLNRMPLFLLLYDALREVAYWLEINRQRTRELLNTTIGNSITLRIPATNVFDSEAVAKMRRIKNRLEET